MSIRPSLVVPYSRRPANLGLGKSAYVPPHLRAQAQRAVSSPVSPNGCETFQSPISLLVLIESTPCRTGWNDSRPTTPSNSHRGGSTAFDSRQTANRNSFFSRDTNRSAGGGGGGVSGWSGPNPTPNASRDHSGPASGSGIWKDGQHLIGSRNVRMEKDFFGDATDPSKQHTGINFEKYDDIPVEATGADVPDPILSFNNSPLDPVLLENIGFAMYTTPTPVQKYSIPIVANGRDLMACAQVM